MYTLINTWIGRGKGRWGIKIFFHTWSFLYGIKHNTASSYRQINHAESLSYNRTSSFIPQQFAYDYYLLFFQLTASCFLPRYRIVLKWEKVDLCVTHYIIKGRHVWRVRLLSVFIKVSQAMWVLSVKGIYVSSIKHICNIAFWLFPVGLNVDCFDINKNC